MALAFDPASFEPVLKALAVAGLPTLEQTLTTVLADTVAGPFGGFVAQAANPLWAGINHALGLDAATPPAETAAAIAALPPETAQEKLAAVQEGHAYLLDDFKARASASLASDQEVDRTALTGDAAQVDLDRQAAASSSFFVYGPRPAIMWALAAVLVLYSLLPALRWFIRGFSGRDWGEAPELPWYVWLGLFALLGIIAALRSLDKRSGTASLPPGAPGPLPASEPRRSARGGYQPEGGGPLLPPPTTGSGAKPPRGRA